jgi:hypothetical protein
LYPEDRHDWIEPDAVKICKNDARDFSRKLYNFNEYALAFTNCVVDGAQEVWSECFDTIPSGLDRLYLDYLETYVVSCDFEPDPRWFLFPHQQHIDEDIESKKKELRPKYIALVAFARGYLDQMA